MKVIKTNISDVVILEPRVSVTSVAIFSRVFPSVNLMSKWLRLHSSRIMSLNRRMGW